MPADFNPKRMRTYLRGYANALCWNNVLAALNFARSKHAGQTRKDGRPYIVHPYTLACHAIALGIRDEVVVAACLLHDVCEDCGVKPEELPVSPEIQDAVRRLTHIKPEPLEPYYRQISENRAAAIVKLLDRCDNVSTMAGVFTREKTLDYIEETERYVLPLLRTVKENWPGLSDAVFVLKYHIMSVTDGLKTCLTAGN